MVPSSSRNSPICKFPVSKNHQRNDLNESQNENQFFLEKSEDLGDLGDAVSAPISKDPGGSAPQTLAWGSAVLICFGQKGGVLAKP